MGPFILLLAQSAAAAAATPAPDIEIVAKAEIGSLEMRSGRAEVTLRADPGIAPPVTVERSAPAGQGSYRGLRITVRAIARLTAPPPIAAIDIKTGDTN